MCSSRLGLGFDEIARSRPGRDGRGLVYCSISGYGLTSPYANEGAYDVVIQGMSGLMSVTGERDGGPVKCGVPVGDFVAGLYAAYTVASLLPTARSTGQSFHVDCPMLDCLLAASALQTSEYWGSGNPGERLGTAHPRNAPYQAFEASDRAFTVAAGTDQLWRNVAEVTGLTVARRRSPVRSQRRTGSSTRSSSPACSQERFRTMPAAHWLSALRARGVPCGPVNTYADIVADEHVRATGLVQDLKVPVAGVVPDGRLPGPDRRAAQQAGQVRARAWRRHRRRTSRLGCRVTASPSHGATRQHSSAQTRERWRDR